MENKKYCKNCGVQLYEDQDVCLRCGVYVGNGNRYCGDCGTEVSEGAAFCSNCGATLKKEQVKTEPEHEAADSQSSVSAEAIKGMQPRNIVTAIVLSIVTCGIYAIYWFIVMTDEINRVTKTENDPSGALSFVLTLITCGIYGYFWAFKMGQKVDKINGTKDSYTGIVYIVLMVVGLSVVAYALIQDTLNKTIERS